MTTEAVQALIDRCEVMAVECQSFITRNDVIIAWEGDDQFVVASREDTINTGVDGTTAEAMRALPRGLLILVCDKDDRLWVSRARFTCNSPGGSA